MNRILLFKTGVFISTLSIVSAAFAQPGFAPFPDQPQGFQNFSQSSQSQCNISWNGSKTQGKGHASIRDLTVTDALAAIERQFLPIYFTEKAAKEIESLNGETVKLDTSFASPQELVEIVVKKSKLQFVAKERAYYLAVPGEDTQKLPDNPKLKSEGKGLGLIRVSDLVLQQILKKPVTIQMSQAPIEAALGMLQGQVGMMIAPPSSGFGPNGFSSNFGTFPRMVEVNFTNTPLKEVLESLAQQVDAKIVIDNGQIRLESEGGQ